MSLRTLPWCLFAALACLVQQAAKADGPDANEFLKAGKVQGGIDACQAHLAKSPKDDQVRFGLGALQFVSAVENLGQNFYRYGLRDNTNSMGMLVPLLRLPVPSNPKPETLSYEDSRRILQQFIDELRKSEESLALVAGDDVKLSVNVTKIKLNFTGNELESVPIQAILKQLRAVRDDRELFVVFDRADVAWLRGYCHLLSFISEVALAYDGQELFDSTAQLFFQKTKSPYPFLQEGRKVFSYDQIDVADFIAFIHLIRMPVKEPARMTAALEHLKACLALSEEMWGHCLAEEDNDHEWIPNPKQKGELGVPVSQQMVDSWRLAAKEGIDVLDGKRLIPFWRGKPDLGVNLRRVFTEPRPLDLVLWAQGTAAAPYLEEGPLTRPEVWTRLQQVFRGNFITFAIWFN